MSINDIICYFGSILTPFPSLGSNAKLLESLVHVENLLASAPTMLIALIFYQALTRVSKDLSSLPGLAKSYTALSAMNWKDLLKPSSVKKDKSEEKGKDKKNSKKEKAPTGPVIMPKVTKPVLTSIDWNSVGLVSSLKIIFDAAILAAFPESKVLNLEESIITRCNNPQFGDFQCNNALGFSKAFKGLEGYQGKEISLSWVGKGEERTKEKKNMILLTSYAETG